MVKPPGKDINSNPGGTTCEVALATEQASTCKHLAANPSDKSGSLHVFTRAPRARLNAYPFFDRRNFPSM